MSRLKKYINEARNTGTDMEPAIISMWNRNVLPRGLSSSINRDGLTSIINYMSEKNIDGEAVKVKNSEVSVTTWWGQYSTDHTPKTDISIGKYNISLKTGNAQLMSGSLKGDAKATFLTAVNKTNKRTQLIKEILTLIEEIPKGIVVSNDPEDNRKKVLTKVSKMNKMLSEKMADFFEKDTDTKIEFTREAMTGLEKFGSKSIGCANYILYCQPDGKNTALHKTSNDSYIKKVSNTTKLNVSFKSNLIKKMVDGENIPVARRSYSVVRLAVGLYENININTRNLNNNDMLNENVITDLYNKIKEWFITFFNKVKEWIGNSFERLLEFLGFMDDEDGVDVMFDDSSIKFS
jgi:hypothetical protein